MDDLLNEFLNNKKLEGCSPKTIATYKADISQILAGIGKPSEKVTTSDIREYLADWKIRKNISNNTLDHRRRIFNSFYSWLVKEKLIEDNPVTPIHKIKAEKVIRKGFSDIDIENLRKQVYRKRDKAMFELLLSSGMRIGEMIDLDIKDIDMDKRRVIVFGKGAKERIVYFNAKTWVCLKDYLAERKDNNPALFVSERPPHDRISDSTVRDILRKAGQSIDVHCHPHRFRRTCATNLLNRGMPVQEVSKLLGHAKLETTLIYCEVDQDNVEYDYRKFMK